MKKTVLFGVLILSISATVFAQKTFLLKEASKNFDVKIKIAKCENDICEGNRNVYN